MQNNSWLRRMGLFLGLNFLIILTVSLVLNLLNVPAHNPNGLDIQKLAIFCLAWGMIGAFISLSLSRFVAKQMLGVVLVSKEHADYKVRQLVDIVERLSRAAFLPCTPEIGIYQAKEVNAFATGPTKSRSLIAVSSTLLETLSEEELEGVIGHEISHIANGDMVTMTLLQGVINAFVMFMARVCAYLLTSGQKNRSEASYYFFVIIFEVVFMLLGSLLVAYYSRKREFRADKGSSDLVGTNKMVAALEILRTLAHPQFKEQASREKRISMANLETLKIAQTSNSGVKKWAYLFATHPSIEERIAKLKYPF